MIEPYQLGAEALAVLRVFIQSNAKRADDALPIATIRQACERQSLDADRGLDDLTREGLLTAVEHEDDGVAVTSVGEAFFARYHRSCH